MENTTDLMTLIHEAGFQGQAAQTMYGIVMAESGGNVDAHNTNANTGDNSYGLAQINMLGSMGPERLQEFGLSSNDQLFDPLTNLRVAYRLSNGGTDFTPWSTYKSGAYQQYAGQGGAQVSAQSAGATPLGGASAPGNVPLTAAQYEQALGALASVFTRVPELKKLLDRAVKEQQPTEDFVNAVQNSHWYRNSSDAYRQYFALQISNPSEYNQEVNNRVTKVREMAAQLGVGLVSGEDHQIATSSLYNNWTDAQVQAAIGAYYARNNGGHPNQGGQAAATVQQVNEYAQAYGVPVTQARINNLTQDVLMGRQTMDGVKQYFVNQAGSLYPGLRQQFAAGQTTKDVAEPYMAAMSNTLELPQTQITLKDPTIQKALQFRPSPQPAQPGQPKPATTATPGGTPPELMPLWQFNNQLREDPRWEQTNNAKQEAYGMLYQLGKNFGFAT